MRVSHGQGDSAEEAKLSRPNTDISAVCFGLRDPSFCLGAKLEILSYPFVLLWNRQAVKGKKQKKNVLLSIHSIANSAKPHSEPAMGRGKRKCGTSQDAWS